MNPEEIKCELIRRVEELARHLFPHGKRVGNHWCVGSIQGEPGQSFKICIAGEKVGFWGDFADSGKHSRSLLDLWMVARKVDFKTALRQAAEWLGQPLNSPNNSANSSWKTLDEAIGVMQRKLGCSTRRDVYHDREGRECFVIVRFDGVNRKEFRPFHQNGSGWVAKDPPGKLPLFHLPELVERSGKRVFVVEGEKCATELATLGLLVTTSSHGAKAAEKTDWRPLAGREVVILPDNDPDGRKYAQDVAGILTRLSPPGLARIVELPGLPPKGDCVEWLEARDAQAPEDILCELERLIAQNQSANTLAGADIEHVSERLNSSKPKVELPCDGRLLSTFGAELAGY